MNLSYIERMVNSMGFTNSSLVTYTNITKNKTPNRKHVIDTITIHSIVGQWTAQKGCDYFATTDRKASANYVVGKDGSIGLSVEEKDRSWCSSNAENDHRAITIEVASDTKEPYKVTDAAYSALIQLVADICKRNNIKQLLWKADKSLVGQIDKQNMTVHRWFANKSCPGDYLYERHGDIASRVNAILNSEFKKDESVKVKREVQVGSIVRLNKGAKTFTGGSLASYVYERNHIVKTIDGDRAVITYNEVVVAAVRKSDLTVVE